MKLSSWVVVGCGALIMGCNGSPEMSPDGGTGQGAGDGPAGGAGGGGAAAGGAGGSGGAGSGAGGAPTQACGSEAATVNGGGVLSPFPGIQYSVTPVGYTLKSMNFVITEDGDSRGPLLEIFGEVQNTSAPIGCSFLPDVTLGFDDVVAIVEAEPHFGSVVMTVTTDCIGAGKTGMLVGAARGITRADLGAATTLSIDLGPFAVGTYAPATTGPIVSGQVAAAADGWVLRGQLSVPTAIRNYGMRVYPRDARGLIVTELLAFPGSLAPLAAGTTIDFETSASPCSFSQYVLLSSWIVGN